MTFGEKKTNRTKSHSTKQPAQLNYNDNEIEPNQYRNQLCQRAALAVLFARLAAAVVSYSTDRGFCPRNIAESWRKHKRPKNYITFGPVRTFVINVGMLVVAVVVVGVGVHEATDDVSVVVVIDARQHARKGTRRHATAAASSRIGRRRRRRRRRCGVALRRVDGRVDDRSDINRASDSRCRGVRR